MRNNNLKMARRRIVEFYYPNPIEVKLIQRDTDHQTIDQVLFGELERREIDQHIENSYQSVYGL